MNLEIVNNRYVTLAISILMMIVSGSVYSFPYISDGLKAEYGFNAKQLNIIGTVDLSLPCISSLLNGFIFDYYGPSFSSIFCFIVFNLGNLLILLTCKGYISASVTSFSFFYALIGAGSSATYIIATSVNYYNFQSTVSGMVDGLLIFSAYISYVIYPQIYKICQGSLSKLEGIAYFLKM
jgi:hypothetical protein